MAVIALPDGEAAFRRNRPVHIGRARAGRRSTLGWVGHVVAPVTVQPAAIGHGCGRRRGWRRRRGLFLIHIICGRLPEPVPAMMPVSARGHVVAMACRMMFGRAMRRRRGLFGLCLLGGCMCRLLRRCRSDGKRDGQGCGGCEEQGFHLVVLLECPVFLRTRPG